MKWLVCRLRNRYFDFDTARLIYADTLKEAEHAYHSIVGSGYCSVGGRKANENENYPVINCNGETSEWRVCEKANSYSHGSYDYNRSKIIRANTKEEAESIYRSITGHSYSGISSGLASREIRNGRYASDIEDENRRFEDYDDPWCDKAY